MTGQEALAIRQLPVYTVKLTVPAREELERAGNTCRKLQTVFVLWQVTLDRPPSGLVCVRASEALALRMEWEPEYPSEIPASWWDRGYFTPCPTCGRALVWFEAGYALGHRVCLSGHHCQLSADGRYAKRRRWCATADAK